LAVGADGGPMYTTGIPFFLCSAEADLIASSRRRRRYSQ